MRILVADKSAPLLAAITATFGRHCDLFAATCRDACMEQVERHKFDVVIACDYLADYTGLGLLSEIASASPGTLLIFAASAERLKRLGPRLALFGLFATLSYPLTPRKLLEALKLARRSLPPRAPKVRHVVLESEWDTGERLGLIEQQLDAKASTPGVDNTDEFVYAGPPTPTASTRSEEHDRSRAEHIVSEKSLAGAVIVDHAIPDRAIPESVIEVVQLDAARVEAAPSGTAPSETYAPMAEEPLWTAANDSIFDATPASPTQARDRKSDSTKPSQQVKSSQPTQRGQVNSPQTASSSQPARSGQVNSPQTVGSSREPAQGAEALPSGKVAAKAAERGVQPRIRVQAVPTDAHRAAFERAVARRNAERDAAARAPANVGQRHRNRRGFASALLSVDQPNSAKTDVGISSPDSPLAESPLPSQSLSQLARIAVNKRPLAESLAASRRKAAHKLTGTSSPKRTVFALGSGVAAVLIIAVLSFELLRSPHAAAEMSRAQPVNRQVFSASTSAANAEGAAVPPFSTAPVQAPPMAAANTGQPQAPQFDPNAAPPDPPPPPALEQPGPMEPPSSMHVGPPLGMVPPGFEPEPDSQ